MLTDLQYMPGPLRSSLSSAASRRACPDWLALSATDADRGSGALHAMQSLSLDAFSLQASFCSPFLFHSSPQCVHLDTMPYLPSWIYTEFLSFLLTCWNATSGVLHPKYQTVSQCLNNGAQPVPVCPPEKIHQVHAGGTPDL